MLTRRSSLVWTFATGVSDVSGPSLLQGSVYKEVEKPTIEVKHMLTSRIRKLMAES